MKIGDTIEDVIAIDNAAVVTKQWNDMLVAREMEPPPCKRVSAFADRWVVDHRIYAQRDSTYY